MAIGRASRREDLAGRVGGLARGDAGEVPVDGWPRGGGRSAIVAAAAGPGASEWSRDPRSF
jgi:hypothetical protein